MAVPANKNMDHTSTPNHKSDRSTPSTFWTQAKDSSPNTTSSPSHDRRITRKPSPLDSPSPSISSTLTPTRKVVVSGVKTLREQQQLPTTPWQQTAPASTSFASPRLVVRDLDQYV